MTLKVIVSDAARKDPNPTLETVIRLAHALGYNLQLVQRVKPSEKSSPKVTNSPQLRRRDLQLPK